MVIFNKENNNNGSAQGTLYIQGMDFKLLLELYDMTFLKENIAPDFLSYIKKTVNKIKKETYKEKKMLLLSESHQFGIEFTDIDNKFKDLIELLLQQEILYSKSRLSAIPKEQLVRGISEFDVIASKKNNQDNEMYNSEIKIGSPRFNYEVESITFAKQVIDLIDEYHRLGAQDYVHNGRRMVDIINLLKVMGLEKNESKEELDNDNKGKVKKLTFN